MSMMLEHWNDDKMDALDAKVDGLDRRIDGLDRRVDSLDRRMGRGFERVDDRFDRMQWTMIQCSAVIIAALIGLIATQL